MLVFLGAFVFINNNIWVVIESDPARETEREGEREKERERRDCDTYAGHDYWHIYVSCGTNTVYGVFKIK